MAALLAPAPTTVSEDPLRAAMNKITNWPGASPTAPTSGGVAPRGDVVNLGTTATLENEVPPPSPDPFADELASLQASNAALSAQIAAMNTPAAATTPEATVDPDTGLTQEEMDAARMSLPDYRNWMDELYRQEKYAENPKILFWSGEGSWLDWLDKYGSTRDIRPVYTADMDVYDSVAKSMTVNPYTGQQYDKYGNEKGHASKIAGMETDYRPQTGNYEEDWKTMGLISR